MKAVFAIDLYDSIESPQYDGMGSMHEYLGVVASRAQTLDNINETIETALNNGIAVVNIVPSLDTRVITSLRDPRVTTLEKGQHYSAFANHMMMDWYTTHQPEATLNLGFSYQCCVGDTILDGLKRGKVAYSRELCFRRNACRYNDPMEEHSNLMYLPTMDDVRTFLKP